MKRLLACIGCASLSHGGNVSYVCVFVCVCVFMGGRRLASETHVHSVAVSTVEKLGAGMLAGLVGQVWERAADPLHRRVTRFCRSLLRTRSTSCGGGCKRTGTRGTTRCGVRAWTVLIGECCV